MAHWTLRTPRFCALLKQGEPCPHRDTAKKPCKPLQAFKGILSINILSQDHVSQASFTNLASAVFVTAQKSGNNITSPVNMPVWSPAVPGTGLSPHSAASCAQWQWHWWHQHTASPLDLRLSHLAPATDASLELVQDPPRLARGRVEPLPAPHSTGTLSWGCRSLLVQTGGNAEGTQRRRDVPLPRAPRGLLGR